MNENELAASAHEWLLKIDEVYESVICLIHFPDGKGYLFDQDINQTLLSWDSLEEALLQLEEFYKSVGGR
jgi:hypothetical protein